RGRVVRAAKRQRVRALCHAFPPPVRTGSGSTGSSQRHRPRPAQVWNASTLRARPVYRRRMATADRTRVRRWMIVVAVPLLAGTPLFAPPAVPGRAPEAWPAPPPLGLLTPLLLFFGLAAPLARRGATLGRARGFRLAGFVVLGVAVPCATAGAYDL